MTERAVDHGIQPTGYERRSARFLVSGALLVDALKMPSNTIVVDIRPGPGYDEYEFIVSHPDLPESDEVVECSPLVTHKREEFVWDWNPSEPAERGATATPADGTSGPDRNTHS